SSTLHITLLSSPTSFLPTRRHPDSTLFPYTTLFRSRGETVGARRAAATGAPQVPHAVPIRVEVGWPGNNAPEPCGRRDRLRTARSEEHTSELQSRFDLVCRLLLEKKKTKI